MRGWWRGCRGSLIRGSWLLLSLGLAREGEGYWIIRNAMLKNIIKEIGSWDYYKLLL